MKQKVDALIKATIDECFERGLLEPTELPNYVVEVPRDPTHGHFATNLPLTLASSQGRNPRDIASIITEHLRDEEEILEKAETAGPGFINFTVRPEQWYRALSDILTLKEDYGQSEIGAGEKVLVEFVSANPTGPLHLGHGRGAALGDTLSRILNFCGYQAVREFYINDAGQQIRLLGESIYSRFRQIADPDYPFPESGYHGDYIPDLARQIAGERDLSTISPSEAVDYCAARGKEIILEEIKDTLSRFRVNFDVFSSEDELHRSGLIQRSLDRAEAKGQLYDSDRALWIRTSAFGDDKDRVLRKNDGELTYFASDIAYHLDKIKRGFDRAVNLWGADHHGYVPRMKAALAANGVPPDWLSVLLIQLVKLWRGGQELKMSKRAGSFVTLNELIDEVGVDAVRFVFLTKHHDSPLDVDIDLVKRRDPDNPVYYVQYAHARICSIFRKAEAAGVPNPGRTQNGFEPLRLPEELALIRSMVEFPALLEEISRTLEPHRLTYYLSDLAASFHKYFNLGTKTPEHRVVTRDVALTQARLSLVEAVKIVIANGLRLLGVSAPERM